MNNFEPNRAFNTEVAGKLGINQAILIQQIRYWQEKSQHEIDGRKWVYNTYKEWSNQLNFISERTVRRDLKALADLKIIKVAEHNISKFNHTKWYSLDEECLAEYIEENNSYRQCQERNGKNGHKAEVLEQHGSGNSDPFRIGQADRIKNKKNTKITTLKNKQNKIIARKEIIEKFKQVTNIDFSQDKWGIKNINERLDDDNDFEQIKSMIEYKASQWKGTHVEKFIRPRTLFGNNFTKYYTESRQYHLEKHALDMRENNVKLTVTAQQRALMNEELDKLLAKI